MQNQNLVIFNNRLVAANSDYSSDAMWVGDYKLGSMQITYVATSLTVSGTFKLQSSDDPIGQTPTNWTDVDGSSEVITAEASDSIFYNISEIGFNWLRVVFTHSGTSAEQTVNGRAVFKTQYQV
jgi:hypothetical protein